MSVWDKLKYYCVRLKMVQRKLNQLQQIACVHITGCNENYSDRLAESDVVSNSTFSVYRGEGPDCGVKDEQRWIVERYQVER